MELTEIVQIIPEVLNTRANISWVKKDSVFTAEFVLDDREYQIFIEYFDFADFEISGIKNVYEVSFTGKNKDSSKGSYKATGSNVEGGHNLKVFLIVKNSVEDKLKDLDFDIVFFDAKKVDEYYESMVSLYQKITAVLRKQWNLSRFMKEYPGFYLFILSKNEIDHQMVDAILSLVKNN